MTNKRKDLKEIDLELVTGGTVDSYPSTYDPNTGKGLPVGYFLQSAKNGAYFYKITEVSPTNNWYHVVTYSSSIDAIGEYVLMMIRYNAIVEGRYIPYGETVPATIKQV